MKLHIQYTILENVFYYEGEVKFRFSLHFYIVCTKYVKDICVKKLVNKLNIKSQVEELSSIGKQKL